MYISNEQELIRSISRGDVAAFEQVFKAYYTDLCKFCFKYLGDHWVAEEIVQEVFVNIWERRKALIINTSLKSYLFTAVRNRSFNYIRLQLPKLHKKVALDHVVLLQEENKEEKIITEDLRHHLLQAIDRLPKKCKLIFKLSRNSGLTHKEIAEELDLSVKTVENHIGLALKKLKEELKPVWGKLMLFVLIYLLDS